MGNGTVTDLRIIRLLHEQTGMRLIDCLLEVKRIGQTAVVEKYDIVVE